MAVLGFITSGSGFTMKRWSRRATELRDRARAINLDLRRGCGYNQCNWEVMSFPPLKASCHASLDDVEDDIAWREQDKRS